MCFVLGSGVERVWEAAYGRFDGYSCMVNLSFFRKKIFLCPILFYTYILQQILELSYWKFIQIFFNVTPLSYHTLAHV